MSLKNFTSKKKKESATILFLLAYLATFTGKYIAAAAGMVKLENSLHLSSIALGICLMICFFIFWHGFAQSSIKMEKKMNEAFTEKEKKEYNVHNFKKSRIKMHILMTLVVLTNFSSTALNALMYINNLS